jgi:putative two-component system response regulator
LNILVVEDDRITLKRLQKFLMKWEHHVVSAQNGSEALEIFLSNEIDIVLTDWMMPEMDGLELIRHISKQKGNRPYVYIILLTARGDKSEIAKTLSQEGVDDYIVKPFDPEELRARIAVGERTVRLERNLKEYSQGLEKIVKRQTATIRKTHEETIIRLLTALESRDQETGGHVRRMGLFSSALAKAAGWPENKVVDLRIAAPMHDIGKIGIPDAILRKNKELTKKEFEIIKSHTTIGEQILKNSEFPMIQLACEIALNHHEKCDGSGYPHGISKEDIPQSARIVAIADVFDALRHDRYYHKASTEEDALEIMHQGRETHFDPDLYDLFLEILPEIRIICKENP